jgi:hypothetical protein
MKRKFGFLFLFFVVKGSIGMDVGEWVPATTLGG